MNTKLLKKLEGLKKIDQRHETMSDILFVMSLVKELADNMSLKKVRETLKRNGYKITIAYIKEILVA